MKYCSGKDSKYRVNPEKSISLRVVPPSQEDRSDVIQVEFRQQASVIKRKRQRGFTWVLVAVMLLMVMPMIRDGIVYFKSAQQYQVLQEEQAALLEVQQRLLVELENLDNPVVIEKMARENLGFVMPGESKIYQAIPTENIPKPVRISPGEAIH